MLRVVSFNYCFFFILLLLVLLINPCISLLTLQKLYSKNYGILNLSTNKIENDSSKIISSPITICKEKSLSIQTESELKSLMDNMPVNEKYALLLQSYSNNILEGKNLPEKNIDTLKVMESLYDEMIQSSIIPDSKSAQAFIDSASTFCNAAIISKTIRFVKAGGSMKCFGLGVGQLSSPTTKKQASIMTKIEVPTDNRKIEVFYASFIAGITALWLGLQIGSIIQSELHPWLTLYNIFILIVGGFDISLNKGERIRQAASGIERLILVDNERQAHCDSAAFLIGYILGLPCFCFKPDVVEAVKLLREYPDALDAYKQPAAALIKPQSQINNFNMFNNLFQTGASKNNDNKILESSSKSIQRVVDLDADLSLYTDDINIRDLESIKLLGIGRLLVWLIAPVAAESLKYGKTILSDPERLLDVLSTIEKQNNPSVSTVSVENNNSLTNSISYDSSCIPNDPMDRQAFVEWAYFEACTLIRQYGDLLEEVKLYMDVGTSTVGECTFMIENEIS